MGEDYKFIDVVDWTNPGRPNGCSYHRYGNVEQWHHGHNETCTVNGYAGCFCKVVEYYFVPDKDCEAYGLESIHDAAMCKAAGIQLAGTHGIREDFKFFDRVDFVNPGRPNGCSYHPFGNVEQWHHGRDIDCDVGNFAGCFCKIGDHIVYGSMDKEFQPQDEPIARIPFGDSMLFSMDITVHSLPSHSGFANVMFCGTSMKDRQFVVAMNENSNDPNNKLEKGFRVFVPAEGSLSRINTPAIEAGKTYHLDVAVDQYTFVILQDGVVVHEDYAYSEHETRDSVPCYIGNPDRDNDNYDADVTVRNILIKDDVSVSCDEHSDCPSLIPFCYVDGESFGVMNGICTVCDECDSYDAGIDGTCGPCGKGYPTSENKADERLFSGFSFSRLVSGSGDKDIESRLVDALRKAGEENEQGMTEQDIGEKLVEGLTMMVDQVSDDEEKKGRLFYIPPGDL